FRVTCAVTQIFCDGPLLPALPLVVGFRVSPPTTTLVEALITVVRVTLEVSVIVHDPVPPDVVHVALLRLPGPLAMLNVIVVPSGVLASPLPMSTFTWPVRVWVALISFVAVAGLIWMLAFTQVFCADPLLPDRPSVVRFRVT